MQSATPADHYTFSESANAPVVCRRSFDLLATEFVKTGAITTEPDHEPGEFRRLRSFDTATNGELIRRIFADYVTHWHYCPTTDKLRAEDAYVEWMYSESKMGRTEILEYHEKELCGFAAVRIDEDMTDILLAGVTPEVQGLGWYRRMLQLLIARMSAMQLSCLNISTQASNIRVQRISSRWALSPPSDRHYSLDSPKRLD